MAILKDVGYVDLRSYKTPEAFRAIERIENVGLLIVPSDVPAEVEEAIAGIQKVAVGAVQPVPSNAKIIMMNGAEELTAASFGFGDGEDVYYLINGAAALREFPADFHPLVIFNGLLLVHESFRKTPALRFIARNGLVQYGDFDCCKFYENTLELDRGVLSFLPEKTALVAVNSIVVAEDVDADLLAQKKALLLCANKIYCYDASAPYIKANAVAGNKIVVLQPGEKPNAEPTGDAV
ncbi:MAG: hypothetical protein ACOX6U_01130 [Oscillospiraceae bacterium]|jgi:hypothetical protein